MVKLKPIIFQSILASFKEIARQGYYSSYRYFHSLGYRINRQGDNISHLLFMDDLKLFAANYNELASMRRIVNKFSDGIGMSFGIGKCKKLTIQSGKIVHMETLNSIMVKN